MNAATAIREQVRMLALEIGEKAAADKLGIQYDRVRQWSHRYGWKRPTKSVQQAVTVVTQPPSLVLADELADNERETRLSLSRYARRVAKDSESATMREAPYVKAVAQVAGITHKWGDQQAGSNHFTLNTLNINCLDITEGKEDNNQA
jgi:hypothetical protein